MSLLLDHNGRPFDVPEPSEAPLGRADRWENFQTGIGTMADKTVHGHFLPVWRLFDVEIANMYNGSDIAGKIITKRNDEMFRRGFELESDDVDKSEVEDFREWCTETFLVEDSVREGRKWGGAFGGLLLILGIDDGRKPWEPLDETRIRSVNFINKVDRRFAYAQSYYSDLDKPKYGQPETYLISNGVATTALSRRGTDDLKKNGFRVGTIHESRCIRFDGVTADVTTQQLLAGWSWSVLQRPYDVVRQFDHIFDSAGYLLSDASQGVFALQGLIKAISSGQKQALATRIQIMEQTRSVMRGIALDAGDAAGNGKESFTRVPTPFTSIPEMLDRFMQRLAACVDMPTNEMFGQGGGGLNAAGEAEAATRKWYDSIQSQAKNEVAPQLKRLFRLLGLSRTSPLKKKGDGIKWKLRFHPLWSPTDKELAETRLANAQRDTIYINDAVVKPEEVAVDLGDVYPHLDVEAREEVLEGGTQFDPYENEPPDEGDVPAGGAEGEQLSPATPLPLLGATAPSSGEKAVLQQGSAAPPAKKPAAKPAPKTAAKKTPKPAPKPKSK